MKNLNNHFPLHALRSNTIRKAGPEITVDELFNQPVFIHDFLHGLKKVMPMKELPAPSNTFLFMKVDCRMIRIDMKDILHVEALGDYVNIHTPTKRYTAYSTMNDIQSRLPVSDFMRVHRSHIVRLDRITELEKETLTIEKDVVPVSVACKQELKRRLNIGNLG